MGYTDVEIESCHERVVIALREHIKSKLENARELRSQAAEEYRIASAVEQAVYRGHWWKLEHIIGKEAVEIFSNCEPSDRHGWLDLEGEDI